MVEKALTLLETPRTARELSALLTAPEGLVERLLDQLFQRGYVKPLACGRGCRGCAFQSLCSQEAQVHWVRTR